MINKLFLKTVDAAPTREMIASLNEDGLRLLFEGLSPEAQAWVLEGEAQVWALEGAARAAREQQRARESKEPLHKTIVTLGKDAVMRYRSFDPTPEARGAAAQELRRLLRKRWSYGKAKRNQ